jgi:hypothetical protein
VLTWNNSIRAGLKMHNRIHKRRVLAPSSVGQHLHLAIVHRIATLLVSSGLGSVLFLPHRPLPLRRLLTHSHMLTHAPSLPYTHHTAAALHDDDTR